MGILPNYGAAPATQEDRYFSQLTSEEQVRFKQETKDAFLLDFKTMRSKLLWKSGVLVFISIAFGATLFSVDPHLPTVFPAPPLIRFMIAVPMLVILFCFFGIAASMFRLASFASKLSQGESGWSGSGPISALERAIAAALKRAITKKENRS